ncbi:MAG: response regulator [Methanoregulaceae archaeon]|nr:response regulator [Methanoregulaceae archaeon]
MDDEESILESYGKLLVLKGYSVVLARDGDEAVEAYRKAVREGEPIDVVIMDLTIPGGMGGREAISRLLEIDPAVRAVISSGYSNDPIISEFRKFGFSAVIPKPYTLRDLISVIEEIMAGKSGS